MYRPERDRADSSRASQRRVSQPSADRSVRRGPEVGHDGDHVGSLHRSIGNRAVQQFLRADDRETGVEDSAPGGPHPSGGSTPSASSVQPSLAMNDPGNRYEREAEQVADAVVDGFGVTADAPVRTDVAPDGIQRMCDRCRERYQQGKPLNCEACEAELRRSADDGGRPSADGDVGRQIQSLRGRGRPLPADVRSYFEPRFGRDFGDVRIHTGPTADEAARGVDAKAFTIGRDVAFRSGAYDPKSRSGKRLLAHELTHVVQQTGDGGPRVGTVQRDDEDGGAGGDSGDEGPPTEPGLDVDTAEGSPCACIAFVHHDEPNARVIANVLADHCAYNLAMAVPKHTERDYEFEGEEHDPNEFFPREVIEECRADPEACARDVEDEDTPRLDRIQKQFFLAIAECTEDFSLPVVALHTNHIWDTAEFLQKQERGEISEEDLDPLEGMTIDKTEDDAGSTVEDLTTALEDLDADASDLTTTEGWTNIFRWCAADALTKCHIGDPANPDDVVWVTTERDFERLSGESINVAYQSDLEEAEESSAEGDLSTMFLILEELYEQEYENAMQEESERVTELREEVLPARFSELGAILDDLHDLWDLLEELSNPAEVIGVLVAIASSLAALMDGLLTIHQLRLERQRRLEQLRYVNIETPRRTVEGTARGSRTTRPSEAYPTVASTLEALGLYCCDEEGHRTIEEELAED